MKTGIIKKLFFRPQRKAKKDRSLIKVCAWCPKKEYPALKPWEEYTHGMCRKHYRQLSIKKDMALSLLIAEMFQSFLTRVDNADEKTKVYLKKLEGSFRVQLEKLSDVATR